MGRTLTLKNCLLALAIAAAMAASAFLGYATEVSRQAAERGARR